MQQTEQFIQSAKWRIFLNGMLFLFQFFMFAWNVFLFLSDKGTYTHLILFVCWFALMLLSVTNIILDKKFVEELKKGKKGL